MAVGAGGVWVANRRAQTLARIDPGRAVETDRFPLGSEPRALAVVDGRLWLAVAAAGAGRRGGTLRVDFQGQGPVTDWRKRLGRAEFDPATSYSEIQRLLSLTNDGLTAFRRVGGTAGGELVPDLAEALPAPSDGGRTYTFTVRDGVRFSTGGDVRPSDIKRGIERALNARQAAYGLLDGIKSIAADDANRTIVIRLRRPDPDFLYRLALPFASAVPPGTAPPPSIVAATGPYRIARFESPRRVRLERNRFYRTWSALAKPDGYPDVIDIRLGVTAGKGIEAVRAGRTDVTYMTSGPAELAKLRRRDPGLIRDNVPSQTIVVVPQHARGPVRSSPTCGGPWRSRSIAKPSWRPRAASMPPGPRVTSFRRPIPAIGRTAPRWTSRRRAASSRAPAPAARAWSSAPPWASPS